MDQEERRLAMLRQRGELEEEIEEPVEEGPRGRRGRESSRQKSYTKGRGKKQKTSLSRRRSAAQRRQQKLMLLRLGLYLGACAVLILVAVSVIKGCGKSKPGQAVSSGAEESDVWESEAAVRPDETGTAQEDQTTKEPADQTEKPEETSEEEESGGLPVTATVAAETTASSKDQEGWPVDISGIVTPDWIRQDFIRINEFSRPYIPLKEVKYIAIHYVGNPDTTAQNNRNYFDHLGDPEDPAYGLVHASAQFVVGFEGEVIQCMPLNEMAYAVHDVYNPYTISIEVCHPDEEGKFTDTTYQGVVKLAAWLLQQFDLDEDALLRHYDCDSKPCPKYYVEHPEAWEQMKADIMEYYNNNPNIS